MNDVIELKDIPQGIFVELITHRPCVDFSLYGTEMGPRDHPTALNYGETQEQQGVTRAFKIRGEITDDKIIVKAIFSTPALHASSLPKEIRQQLETFGEKQ